jgi:iron complex outermembrane recepter protein
MRFVPVVVLCMLASFASYGQLVISGKVTDPDQRPLAGATVQLVGTNRAVATSEQGEFNFAQIQKGQYLLKVSFVGHRALEQELVVSQDVQLNLVLEPVYRHSEDILVEATRAGELTPTTFTNVKRADLDKLNQGQDIPFLLNFTPSVVATSDAGAGIGYTGLRIRGSDPTRINVTINGIPLNDSESQGVFWVNMPDMASSTESIQIQRGVGTSTNGAAAFGATINLQTNTLKEEPYAEMVNGIGSFGSRRHTVSVGTGLLDNKWTVDARLSKIDSDGFMDRAFSDLSGYYLSAGYHGKNTVIKALMFGGRERTYQAWYGVPESRLRNDAEAMELTVEAEGWNSFQRDNLINSNSRTYNPYTYDNEIDNYGQDHYQLHFSHKVNPQLIFNMAGHYTRGAGYFEQFRFNDRFSRYGLDPVQIGDEVISRSDIVRRRWLDNHFYGATGSVHYDDARLNVVLGGAINNYVNDHFGEIIWARVAGPTNIRDRYYDNTGEKFDVSSFLKVGYKLTDQLYAFADMQVRNIRYKTNGLDKDRLPIDISRNWWFANPKAGFSYQVREGATAYVSYSVGNREPVRSDMIDAQQTVVPVPERLHNWELGYRQTGKKVSYGANAYLMSYNNQLIITGELNDVGAALRTNVDDSYRAGIEMEAGYRFSKKLHWMANLTLSQNKIRSFTEVEYRYTDDYSDLEIVEIEHRNTDIAMSPNVIAGSIITYEPLEGVEVNFLSKYVGRQFLDNTSNVNRSLDAYFVNDVRISYSWKPRFMQELSLALLVNNVFNLEYESNGYTWGYFRGETDLRQNYFYPQAGTNFMLSLAARF